MVVRLTHLLPARMLGALGDDDVRAAVTDDRRQVLDHVVRYLDEVVLVGKDGDVPDAEQLARGPHLGRLRRDVLGVGLLRDAGIALVGVLAHLVVKLLVVRRTAVGQEHDRHAIARIDVVTAGARRVRKVMRMGHDDQDGKRFVDLRCLHRCDPLVSFEW